MIGCRTINIPEIILGVHGLVGFTVTCNATLLRFKLRENLESSALNNWNYFPGYANLYFRYHFPED